MPRKLMRSSLRPANEPMARTWLRHRGHMMLAVALTPGGQRRPRTNSLAIQNVERYRRLLKTATDEKRRDYLGRLIAEEQQRQKDAGDPAYPY